MSDCLNTESARAYVRAMMADYGAAIISRAEMREESGFAFCTVTGAYFDRGEWSPFEWDVWFEYGRIYGEW